ncbi:PhnB protein [Chitinophaga niastensis]|uniref:PhnB protein n=1 Tax=Chitinophaga niastensis TaxID=536980 RepID=A0A2P8HRC3_CHINA|nr:VOC family protein [Chitinophaga niastensis]PSL48744.1 PhnB protein [Chitinophaga niastensis]
MSTLNVYLVFDGNTREAMTYYKEAIGGDLKIMTVGESPMKDHMPPEMHGQVMHALLQTPSFTLMASDGMMGKPPVNGDSVALAFGVTSNDDAENVFAKLSDGGNVTMPIQETFWAYRYGQLTDKFGINWMVNYNKPMP